MNDRPDEKEQLRSVAPQSARSVFLPRQGAEEELARTTERLAQQSELLRVTLASIGDGVMTAGTDGRVLSMNAVAVGLTGWTEEEARGRSFAEVLRIVDEETHSPAADPVERALREGRAVALANHTLLVRRDGSEIPIDDTAAPIRDEQGRVHGVVVVFRSVEERRRAERELSRSQRELRVLAAIVESSQDAIISKTLDSRVRSWNAAAEELFGYRADEMIGEPITRLIPPERQDEERTILERLRRGERVEHYETVRVAKDGRRIDVSLTISPVRDSTGRIVGASKIARDITARKRAELRLATQISVTQALAECASLQEAAPRILQSICDRLDWPLAALWRVDGRAEGVLRCVEVCHRSGVDLARFEATSRDRTLARGAGLPGRVWASGEPVVVADMAGDLDLPRGAVAAADGIHGAAAFPVALNAEFLGVIELFSQEVRRPDEDLLRMMTAIASQLAQFVERKRAEAALRDSEQRFRVMADALPSIIWTAAADGVITYANDRWVEYFGLTPQRGGRGWPELGLHPDDRARCREAWASSVRDGTPYEIEARNRRHDGAYRWFVTRAVPLRDAAGRVVQWVGTTNDIDHRKKAEQTTRFLADASAALSTLTDHESTLQQVATLAVPHFADWCAVDVLELDGSLRRLAVAHADPDKVQLVRELDRRYPPHAAERRGVPQVIRTGEVEWAAFVPDEGLAASAHGEEHLRLLREVGLRSYVSVPLKARSRVLGVLTFATAESGRAYDANDVRAAEDLASRTVIAMENATLLATLREADRRKDEFLAMLAHELRNPLAPIRNAAHILRVKGPPTPELQWATDVIGRQVHQMTRLVDDLLDVSRITRGKIELRRELVEIAAVVKSAVEASRPLIEKWGHELTVVVPPDPIRLEADPTRLAQVLSNVLTNAAKYTDHGGHIRLLVETRGAEVVVRVEDDGIGIPKEALPRIFDMFTQLPGSLERSEGGLGIGLTLVRRLVELHGGTVEARSEGPGKGSEFVLRLPLASERAWGRERGGGGTTVAPARRILVVDDNRDAADSLGMLLGMGGNDVRTAHDGLEAVSMAAEFRPDVILLDIGLPKLSGYEVARRIRAQEGGAGVLLVALTGWGQEEDRRRSREAGFDHHLTKPVEFDALRRLLAGLGEPPPSP